MSVYQVVGAGTDHTWIVTIADQESSASTTSYGAPVITDISGPGSMNASTFGGERVTLTGRNFGPPSPSFLDSVTYGPGGTEYTANLCNV